MPLVCPTCKAPALDVPLFLEFPPDGGSDEVTLQTVSCERCGFAGVGLYEESRRGPLGRESVHHVGWHLTRAEMEKLSALMRTCSDPGNLRCQCTAHLVLGKRDPSNSWDGLRQNGYVLGDWFRIDYVHKA